MEKIVRVDSRNRVSLGEFGEGLDLLLMKKDKKNRIILEPLVGVPAIKLQELESDKKSSKNKK